jgi:HSP20 family protein
MALSLFGQRDLLTPDEFFGPLFRPMESTPTFRDLTLPRAMPLDVSETAKSFEVKADIPGVKKEEISVSVDNNILTVKVDSKGEKSEEREEQGVKYHRVERHQQFMSRSLRMPENAALDNIKAKYDNGVLNLSMPKKEIDKEKAAKMIEIQ